MADSVAPLVVELVCVAWPSFCTRPAEREEVVKWQKGVMEMLVLFKAADPTALTSAGNEVTLDAARTRLATGGIIRL